MLFVLQRFDDGDSFLYKCTLCSHNNSSVCRFGKNLFICVGSGPYSRAKEVLITQGIEHDMYRHNLFLRRNTVDVYNRPERLQSNLFGLGQLTNRHVLSTPDSLCIV